ncbi:SPASM domain-containing protein [Azospirillum sp. B506]|uniref:SPASM domain-containing protein n=1 Tax=Azospirillum sp. B506 TaxID=137721 RepID=UPI0011DCB3E8|nr:SPASM domain-containing protein [Azospirillum sp. B506]
MLPTFIEIETSTKCNRRCAWCPGKDDTLRRQQTFMKWGLFEKILHDLADIRYDRTIALHNYNEPTLNGRLAREVRHVRDTVNDACVAVFSNGDRLNRNGMVALADAGLGLLRITIYPADARTIPSADSVSAWIRRAEVGELPWTFADMPDGKGVCADSILGEMQIRVIRPNIMSYNSRAGTIALHRPYRRTSICTMTTTSAAVTYQGELKMCCNIYPSIPEHRGYILGNLADRSFAVLWGSEAMQAIRMSHLAADWRLTPICEQCERFDVLGKIS